MMPDRRLTVNDARPAAHGYGEHLIRNEKLTTLPVRYAICIAKRKCES